MHVFSKFDYDSPNGMDTHVWGPLKWSFLHTISFAYPVSPSQVEKTQYYNYIMSLNHILPCIHCRKNIIKNLSSLNFGMKHMKSRDVFSRFIHTLHDSINIMLGKKIGPPYDEIRNRYEHFRARCMPDKKLTKNKTSNKTKSKTENGKLTKKETGCDSPVYGVKSKCIISIVPRTSRKKTFKIDNKCKLKPVKQAELSARNK